MKGIPLGFRSICTGRASIPLVGLQAFSSHCSCSRMPAIFGRAGGKLVDSYSSNHVWVNGIHNASENPAVGRSGRTPLKTFFTTTSSLLVFSKGFWPVMTYGREIHTGRQN